MTKRVFIHTLAFPEHIWIKFFRDFFCQDTLIVDEDGVPMPNNFKFQASESPERRKFDILFESDLTGANPNTLPALVIEDLGMASMGIAINRLSDWTVSPRTSKTRSDLLRTTYVFHCCSRTRGESRLMASIVIGAMTAFYDALLKDGLHKIEPWSVGKTVPIKSDSDEVYLDTPISVSFETQETWKTVEVGSADVERFCLVIAPDKLVRYVRMSMSVTEPSVIRYINTAMLVQGVNVSSFINTSIDIADQLAVETYTRTSMDVENPLSADRFVRTSIRVT
jgi:hypothetical protein